MIGLLCILTLKLLYSVSYCVLVKLIFVIIVVFFLFSLILFSTIMVNKLIQKRNDKRRGKAINHICYVTKPN